MVEMNFKVDAFEGPLDLLLHLIGQLEVDIYDIPMAEITDQYMEFVHTMQEMELDVASEYLVMAATLLAIKSKMLLPKQELEIDYDTLEEEEDPRDALVEKLMEYKRFKEAAKELKEKEAERSFYFSKPPMDLAEYDDGTNVAELDVSLND
ncbi:segregation/condensation protein A, partial [Listeria ivanovii]